MRHKPEQRSLPSDNLLIIFLGL